MSTKQLKNEAAVEILRKKAELQLARIPASQETMRSTEEMLYELQVRQIELEMQNEELRRAYLALEESRDHYADLYEFAPVCYITLSADDLITEINLAGAKLLGEARKQILGRRFVRYVTPEQGDDWYLYFLHARKLGETQAREFALVCADGGIIQVRLDSQSREQGGDITLRIALTDITARKQAEFDLEVSRVRLQQAIAQRDAMREEERKRIAIEVHDELGQILTGLKLQVSNFSRLCAKQAASLCDSVKEIAELTEQAMSVARNITVALRPVEAEIGIVFALELQASRFSVVTGIQTVCAFPDDTLLLNERCTTALYRIVQELLTNAARHAKADRVDISLCMEGGDYVVTVRDNGIGFDPAARKPDSFGLPGIRDRVLMLGGRVEVNSGAGIGTEVTARIPAEICHA